MAAASTVFKPRTIQRHERAWDKSEIQPAELKPSVVCELWEVSGIGWRLPISVEWHGNLSITRVRMGGGIALLKMQRAVLRKVLDKVGEHRDDNRNAWWILPDDLNAIAQKVESEDPDPEDVVLWSIEAGRKETVTPIFESAMCNEFLEFYCRDGLLGEPVEAAVAYQDFCNHGLRWMLLHQKPWDLGFAVLYPTPMRADWKQIIEGLILKQQGKRYSRIKDLTGKLDYFVMGELLSLLWGGELIRWNIEVKLRKGWHLVNLRMERSKHAKGKPKQRNQTYTSLVNETLRRLLPYHCELFLSYLRQTTCPTYRFRKNTMGQFQSFLLGESEFLKKESVGVLPPIAWRGNQAFIRLVESQRVKKHIRRKLVVETPEGWMLKVPRPVRPKKPDVWKTWDESAGPDPLAF